MAMEWNPDDPLGRGIGETIRQYNAFCDYVTMGDRRSIAKLHAAYCADLDEAEQPTDAGRLLAEGDLAIQKATLLWQARGETPPTRSKRRLEIWSTRNDWQKRLEARADLDHLDREARREVDRRRAEDEAVADSDLVVQTLRTALDGAIQNAETRKVEVAQKLTPGPGGGAQVEIAASVEVGDVEAWLDARLKAERLRRLGLGMPEKYTQTNLAGVEDSEPIKVKTYVGISPDDWDEIVARRGDEASADHGDDDEEDNDA